MKFFLVVAGLLLGGIAVSAFYFMPISNHFARYLWWRLTTDVAATSGDVFSRDTKIHYTVYGDGTPILLLHGGLSNKLSWFSQLPVLSDCGYRLILLDSRGHGLSGLGNAELSYRLLADDALAVLDRLNVQQADVLGWSDGANTALLLAGRWPKRVGKIVAISGNSSPQGLTVAARQQNLEQPTGITYWLYRFWTGAEDKFLELVNRLKHLWRHGPVIPDTTLKDIKSRVLLIVGDHDVVTVEHAQDMNKLLPDSRLHIVRDGGHSTLITHATEVNKQILDFLGPCKEKPLDTNSRL